MKKKVIIYSTLITMIDFIIKYFINNFISLNEEIKVINNFFYLTKVYNTGGAWSIFPNNAFMIAMISIVVLIIIFLSVDYQKINKIEIISYSLLFGGILGNLVDRLLYRHVIDYLSFSFGSYQFPVFNLADICIVISVIILLFISMKKREK